MRGKTILGYLVVWGMNETPSDRPEDGGEEAGTDGEPDYVRSWKEHTTGFDRIRSVASSLSEPRTAGWIAEEAHVSEPTARNHLGRLVDLGVLVSNESARGQTYYPDPVYTRLTALQELVTSNTETELAEQAASVQRDIERWKDRFDVEAPSELRASIAERELAVEEVQERLDAAADWESARYHLSLLRDAIDHYDTYTAGRSASA